MLITDYSPIMFDFANSGRPIVIFAGDHERYAEERGIYFGVLSSPPGIVATSADELLEILETGGHDTDETRQRLDAFRSRFCEFEDGSASERTVDSFFGHNAH
jgi:CDP-glycerol glycerophosphotransferase